MKTVLAVESTMVAIVDESRDELRSFVTRKRALSDCYSEQLRLDFA